MANITKINLLNVPLEADYKHTLYFTSKQTQTDYFLSKIVKGFEDFNYQRKDNIIRIALHFDELCGKVNYVMYQNKAYNNKWFYAFIVDIKYVSDGMSEIYIKTDVMQTWFFDYTLKSCFVEREHTKNDTVGANTLPEDLETGEYICNNTIHDNSLSSTTFVVASAVNLTSDTGADSGLKLYNGVVNGWAFYTFDTIEQIESKLNNIAELRSNDAIVSIFVMPKAFFKTNSDGTIMENHVAGFCYWDALPDYCTDNDLIYKPTNVNGYTPHNKKLLTYPYCYLLMDNNAGATAVYHYELFNNPDGTEYCNFKINGAITPSASIRLLPLYYNGVQGENNSHGLTAGKFPICGWQSDYYTNWLTQNALNIEVQAESIKLASHQQLANDIAGTIGAGMSGDVGALLSAGASSITNSYFNAKNYLNQIKGITAQKQMHAFQSPTVSGNVNSGDVNFVTGNLRFSAYQMSIKQEYAKIIDDFFSMYGYQTNRVKIPNKNHRERYWYTKTVGCEIDGAIPNNDIAVIKACYDNGITFWKNPVEIGKYTNDNGELKTNIIT